LRGSCPNDEASARPADLVDNRAARRLDRRGQVAKQRAGRRDASARLTESSPSPADLSNVGTPAKDFAAIGLIG